MFLGCMWSGKTERLIGALRRSKYGGMRVLALKYVKDQRYEDEQDQARGALIRSHDGDTHHAVPVQTLMDITIDDFDVIGIDEGQFFDDLPEFMDRCIARGIKLFVAALDAWADGTMCVPIVRCMPMSVYKKVPAICPRCLGEAVISSKIVEGGERIDIGGAEKYESHCRLCHLDHVRQQREQEAHAASFAETVPL
jgi:thymidine kinase